MTAVRPNRIGNFFARRWLAIFNTFLAIYVALPILAPSMMLAGLRRPAELIYTVYSPTCHQMAHRSFFLGGEQYAYPLIAAHTNLTPFEHYAMHLEQFREVNPDANGWPVFFQLSREFVGTTQMGFKTAICQRDIGIFGFLLVGSVLYATVGRRLGVKWMPLWLFVIIGMGPIALDGFSQLFGYPFHACGDPAYNLRCPEFLARLFQLRESPPALRFGTGAWFGFCLAWLAIPYLDHATRRPPL